MGADQQPLAEPFSQIFKNREQADWAFDWLLDTVKRLGIEGPYDFRFALTLAQHGGKPALHLNFGGWLVLGFRGTSHVELVVLAEQVAWDERLTELPYDRKEGEPEVRSYVFPLQYVQPLSSDLQQAYHTTLNHIAAKFEHWRRAIPWRRHTPEIIEALFDSDKRNQLLVEGLKDSELLYERHLTSFYQDVSEERELYQTEEADITTPPDEILPVTTDPAETHQGQHVSKHIKEQVDDLAEIIPRKNNPYPLSQLVNTVSYPDVELKRWVNAIHRKGQAILYGPPGTGKTFLANELARHLIAEGDGFQELIQFHPAYAYEDFMQGIRPESDEVGRLTYPLKPGRFLEFCHKASVRQDTCVLIIDEINRANLAQVFGELMYLLEYREQRIPLAAGRTFKIPSNVRIIGTMNTADRSIALVDHALRRRFAFVKLAPNYELLRQYHQATDFPIDRLVTLLTNLNQSIDDPHYEIGITFFLHQDLSVVIQDIWRMEIEPYLEEYFLDADKVTAFRWETVEAKLGLAK